MPNHKQIDRMEEKVAFINLQPKGLKNTTMSLSDTSDVDTDIVFELPPPEEFMEINNYPHTSKYYKVKGVVIQIPAWIGGHSCARSITVMNDGRIELEKVEIRPDGDHGNITITTDFEDLLIALDSNTLFEGEEKC